MVYENEWKVLWPFRDVDQDTIKAESTVAWLL